MKLLPPLLLLALAGCSYLPRDPEGTLERVRAERRVRIGVMTAPQTDFGTAPAAFAGRIARATGARPEIRTGASEPLLLDLQAGRLDLVLGMVAPESPWRSEVAMLRPIAEQVDGNHILLTPIARNGENAWIMLLDREARAERAAR
jgi:hypothetical protein